jgi:hypothetical protein
MRDLFGKAGATLCPAKLEAEDDNCGLDLQSRFVERQQNGRPKG